MSSPVTRVVFQLLISDLQMITALLDNSLALRLDQFVSVEYSCLLTQSLCHTFSLTSVPAYLHSSVCWCLHICLCLFCSVSFSPTVLVRPVCVFVCLSHCLPSSLSVCSVAYHLNRPVCLCAFYPVSLSMYLCKCLFLSVSQLSYYPSSLH